MHLLTVGIFKWRWQILSSYHRVFTSKGIMKYRMGQPYSYPFYFYHGTSVHKIAPKMIKQASMKRISKEYTRKKTMLPAKVPNTTNTHEFTITDYTPTWQFNKEKSAVKKQSMQDVNTHTTHTHVSVCVYFSHSIFNLLQENENLKNRRIFQIFLM